VKGIQARFIGVELFFEDLEHAKKFYVGKLGLEISDEQVGHHAKFDSGAGFVCLEQKGLSHIHPRTKLCFSVRFPT